MAGEIQKVKTILIPEIGLDVVPESVIESEISTDFSRTLSHIAAKTGNRSILIKATSDGRLLVASGGTAYENYDVEDGAAPDAYDAPNTYDQVEAWYVTDIIIETHPAEVSFRNQAGVYGADIYLPVGAYSIDLVHYGMRIQNFDPPNIAEYWFTIYR